MQSILPYHPRPVAAQVIEACSEISSSEVTQGFSESFFLVEAASGARSFRGNIVLLENGKKFIFILLIQDVLYQPSSNRVEFPGSNW